MIVGLRHVGLDIIRSLGCFSDIDTEREIISLSSINVECFSGGQNNDLDLNLISAVARTGLYSMEMSSMAITPRLPLLIQISKS